ncbi:MAG: hypothetical protein IT550_15005 [Novosphingobium sp.]|nr:hypothetical protein [Novosphingobium sp.]
MAVGKHRRHRIAEVVGRHFVQFGKAAGLENKAFTDILERTKHAPDKALSLMPSDSAQGVHDSIAASAPARLRLRETAFEEL